MEGCDGVGDVVGEHATPGTNRFLRVGESFK